MITILVLKTKRETVMSNMHKLDQVICLDILNNTILFKIEGEIVLN